MPSFLKLALEGELDGSLGTLDTSGGQDNQSGQPVGTAPTVADPQSATAQDTPTGGKPEAHEGSPEKELIVLKGPLAEQFSQALAQIYSKTAEQQTEDQQQEDVTTDGSANTPEESSAETTTEDTSNGTDESTDNTALESQANDALTLQDFAENIQLLSEDEASDASTTVYGVDAKDVKPEDVVEVSQDINEFDPEDPDFVVVMTADLPSDNGQGGGENAEPEINQYGKALEAMCDRAGVPLYFSLEAYAHAKKQSGVHKGNPEKQKEVMMHFTKAKGQRAAKEATAAALGLDYCDPEVLGVVVKLTQEKIDPNLGEDTEFFPEGSKIDKLKAEKVKDFIKAIELHFGAKIPKDAGMNMTTPKSIAKYFSKGKINGKPVKTV
jgi:hypothetical protein